jgi:hypothetical protein
MMHAESLWNHDAYFDYIDRWMTENDAAAVATIKSETGLDYSADWERQGQAWDVFVDEMWSTYRNNLPQTSVGMSALPPRKVRLFQNYPNPFNPITAISYQLSAVSNVKLVVYNMLGSEVAVLVNERRNAGVHEVRFDGSSLASGVYFYRLKAGGFTETRKFILLK